MAGVGINELPEAESLAGTESIPVDTGTDTKRASVALIRAGLLPENGDASAVTAKAAGTSTDRPLEERFAEVVNLLDFASHVTDGDWQAAFAAAVAAIPAGGARLMLPPQRVMSGAAVTITDKPVEIAGHGLGISEVLYTGATGGFIFTDSATGDNSVKTLSVRNFSILTNTVGLTAIRAKWRPCAFFLGQRYCDIGPISIRTVDNSAAQSWAKGIHLTSVQGSDIRSVSVTNQRDVPSGDGILFDGFSLANTVTERRMLYMHRGVAVDPLPIAIVTFGGQTTNLTPGKVLTSSGGATGVLLFTVADYGATGTLAIAPIAGTWTVGHTLSDPLGGNGTVTAVDLTRTWGSEGLYVTGGEDVGCDYGFHADCTPNTAKKFTGFKLEGGHSNAFVECTHLAYVSQVGVKGRLLYVSGNNAIGVRVIGCDDADVVGNQVRPAAVGLTGTVGIKTEPAVGGNVPNECARATIQGNSVDGLATGISIGVNSTYADVRFNRMTSCTTDIVSAAATFPGTASGTLIQDNRLSISLDNQIVGPQTTTYRADGGLVRFALQNASRTFSINNYGLSYTPNNAFVLADETAGANRLVLDASGNISIGDGANPLARLHARKDSTTTVDPTILVQNQNVGAGSAGIAFQVAASGEYTGYGPKAAILLERGAANGRGPLKVYNRSTNDTAGYAAADIVWQWNNDGSIGMGSSGSTIITASRHFVGRPYTVATLPTASPANQRINISDRGNRPAWSTGSGWIWADGTTVS